MWYLMEQYITYLAIAFLIGLVVGWVTSESRRAD